MADHTTLEYLPTPLFLYIGEGTASLSFIRHSYCSSMTWCGNIHRTSQPSVDMHIVSGAVNPVNNSVCYSNNSQRAIHSSNQVTIRLLSVFSAPRMTTLSSDTISGHCLQGPLHRDLMIISLLVHSGCATTRCVHPTLPPSYWLESRSCVPITLPRCCSPL